MLNIVIACLSCIGVILLNTFNQSITIQKLSVRIEPIGRTRHVNRLHCTADTNVVMMW